MKSSFTVICLLLALAPISFAADRDPKVLMDADRAFAKATAERGADGWMEFMAPNAVDLTRETLVNLDQIRAEMISEFKLPGISIVWEPYKAEYLGGGNVGYTIGHYEVRYNGQDGKPVVRKGTYLTTWQQQTDGTKEGACRHRQPRPSVELSSCVASTRLFLVIPSGARAGGRSRGTCISSDQFINPCVRA